jgi:hypothetical protein
VPCSQGFLDSHPRLAWAGLIPQLWTFGTCWNKNCLLFCSFAEDFTRIAPPHVGPCSCKAHSIRIYWPGLSNIGKTYPLSSLPPLFQGFWILTLKSTLGSWGYPPYVDFWDLSAKISPLVFACLISRLLDSHPHIYLGLMGLSLRCRLLGLVGQKFPPLSSPALFQGFWTLTLISTLGSWGYAPDIDFWD